MAADGKPDPINAGRAAVAKLRCNPFAPREVIEVLGGLLDHIEDLGARLRAIEQGVAKSERDHRHSRMYESGMQEAGTGKATTK